ncbi:uncharacterized protein A1O9_02866 [Exophiala aquamarina CBS 119918]|uniref:Uncharacterized protein n=1 Tax=Exophiala aquamarina CBS 119918 TaxID=1182545 RepID=A0A072PN70_9EURO|nr:uncharacterized protein A1O9_02866 [Exophiala aquamarina CBS 119918]KEF61301.1 hypothetical protein A1O9_02866 [Exophiala aquamarina CBS 119918]
MPTSHGVTVSMHKEGGGLFTEFDTRNLRSSGAAGQVISSMVLCEDNQKFTIKVKTARTLPPLQTKRKSAHDPFRIQAKKQSDGSNVNSGLSGADNGLRKREWDDEGRERLLVKVFIDGNPCAECASVVTLGDERVLRGRLGHDAIGRMVTKDWSFTSVGIEHLLRGMTIKREDCEIPTDAHSRDLIELQNQLNGDILGTTKPKLAQGIDVQVSRVRTHASRTVGSCSKYAGDYPDRADNLIEGDMTHMAGVVASSRRAVLPIRVHYEYVDENEKVFVTFRFQYMAKQKLYNLGLCHEDGRPTGQKRADRISGLNLLPPTLKRSLGTYQEESNSTPRTPATPTLRAAARPYVPKSPPHVPKRSLRSGLSGSTSSYADTNRDDRGVEPAVGAEEGPRKRPNISNQGTQLTFNLPVRRKMPHPTKDAQVKGEVKGVVENCEPRANSANPVLGETIANPKSGKKVIYFGSDTYNILEGPDDE